MEAAENVYRILKNDFGFKNATGSIKFNLKDFSINVEQNNIVGNILEEWLAKWLTAKKIAHIYNKKQESPDFWLDPTNLETDWLEIKSFTGSPNFDIAAFRSFINLIINKPYKLHSKFLLIKYSMHKDIVTIEDFWLKNLWEISSPSEKWPIKVQYKNKVIVNIRPAVWYSDKTDFSVFKSLEHFLAALEQTIYKYHDTNSLADNWSEKLCKSYKNFYKKDLIIPRWNDIKNEYITKE
ncbi:MAG: NgoBV family restriction endonuclease [Marinifilaceae bacterium]